MFENKLDTACELFHKNLRRGNLPLSVPKAKVWLDSKFEDREFQEKVLEIYYSYCRINAKYSSKNP